MRTVLIAAAGLFAVWPGASPAVSAAPAVRVLHAHRVAEDAVLVGQADATTVALRTVTVRGRWSWSGVGRAPRCTAAAPPTP